MFNSARSRHAAPLPTSSGSYRRDPRAVPAHRVFARQVLARPLSAFVAFVVIILSLAWLAGLTKDEERARLGGGLRVVARDWTRPLPMVHRKVVKSSRNGKQGKGKTHKPDQVVLILTPMKNSIEHIWHFFHLIDSLSYPRHLLQIGVLVSDSSDRTYARALELADERQYSRARKQQHYGRISVFNQDFALPPSDSDSPEDATGGGGETAIEGEAGTNVGGARHGFGVQVQRRKLLARSRTWLLGAAMTPEVDWALWIDVDVVDYDADLIEHLLDKANETSADVVVPNCMWKTYNEMGSYDRNNWAETPASLEMKSLLKPEDVLIEGYEKELKTHRKNMADLYPVTPETPATMALDGVGGCTTLVKASLHRQGAIFPAWPVDHQLETEGFAQIAKRLGGKLVGLPMYYVYHGLYG
ncbi:hypothetical protein RQP46_009113 [Phenoliferia psychrophenolica]